MSQHIWKVVPLSPGQLKDVRPSDVLEGGLYRKCETYRGGGGYDLFPAISKRIFGEAYHKQFIVQLKGCNLDCPYCYVTREGVWGKSVKVSTADLVTAFIQSYKNNGTNVFHLMGGAPALQLKFWPELIKLLSERCNFPYVFHSDLMLTEGSYSNEAIQSLATLGVHNCNMLLALNIKGMTFAEHLKNTRKEINFDIFWSNLNLLEVFQIPYYITSTGDVSIDKFWEAYARCYPHSYEDRKADSFSIDIIEYDAQPFVDEIPWGGTTSP